jgi:hypothetical protein
MHQKWLKNTSDRHRTTLIIESEEIETEKIVYLHEKDIKRLKLLIESELGWQLGLIGYDISDYIDSKKRLRTLLQNG